MTRRLTKTCALELLLGAGIKVSSVFDIGVQRDTLELRRAFPTVPHFLFDPIVEYNEDINEAYEGLDYKIENIAVSDRDGVLWLKEFRNDESGVLSHVHPALYYEEGLRTVPARSLDSYMRDAHALNPALAPYLIKIDVDGHETEILRGAMNCLKSTSCLIVESTLSHVSERCALAEKAGMILWDIVDLAYFHGNLYQVDLIFISEAYVPSGATLNPHVLMGNPEIDRSQWYQHQGSDDA
jgi:FkbM family methyltransferase